LIKLFYGLRPELVQKFADTKDHIISERSKYKTAEEIELVKKDILEQCQINEIIPGESLKLNVQDDFAVIPIQGMLVNQVDFCSAFFGETVTTYEFIQKSIQLAEESEDVKGIIFDVNSGGGYVEQCEETFQLIAGCKKKTHAVVHDMAASAAYWLASGADEIISVSKTGFFGSIGVAAEIINHDKQDESRGIRRLVVTNDDSTDKRPDYDTEEGMQVFKDELNSIFNVFVKSILEKRSGKLSEKSIKALKGQIKISADAIFYGLADKYIKQSELSDYFNSEQSGNESDEISTYVQHTTPAGETEEAMNLEKFLAENPDAMAAYKAAIGEEYERGVEAGKKEKQTQIDAAAKYLESDKYKGAIRNLAVKVLKGESKVEALEGAVTAFDMMAEQTASKAAQDETEELGDSKPEHQDTAASDNGEIKNPVQLSVEVKRIKEGK
jgi:ClpP class serine protease